MKITSRPVRFHFLAVQMQVNSILHVTRFNYMYLTYTHCTLSSSPYYAGFRLGFSSRGGGKCNNCQANGGREDYNTSNAFSLARNIIEIIDFLKLGGSGVMLPKENS